MNKKCEEYARNLPEICIKNNVSFLHFLWNISDGYAIMFHRSAQHILSFTDRNEIGAFKKLGL